MIGTILTVCIGNICRSPMAEGLLRQRLPGLSVDSAGIAALIGQPAEPHAAQLLKDQGVDIGEHTARQLVGWMCDQADLILVMDSDQKRAVEEMYPTTRGKVFRLGEYGKFDIFDPYRSGRDEFANCLLLIEKGVDDWVERIKAIS